MTRGWAYTRERPNPVAPAATQKNGPTEFTVGPSACVPGMSCN
jgi:hypothetical protein